MSILPSPLASTPLPCRVPCHPPIMRSLTLLPPPTSRPQLRTSPVTTWLQLQYIITYNTLPTLPTLQTPPELHSEVKTVDIFA